jgi:uncharacterized protein YdaU (DUF1376 family)
MKRRTLAPAVTRISPASAPKVISFALLPWYPSSFLSKTRGWSVTARGIYRELLDCQWAMGGLPNDESELQRLIGATNAEWKSWCIVKPKFPEGSDGLRRNERLEQHRARSIERSRKAAASARERWRKGNGTSSDHRGGGNANA